MAFSLYCLIDSELEGFSLDIMFQQLKYWFSKTHEFNIEYEEDPFDPLDKHLLLSWGKWWIRVFFETGQSVLEDSREISRHADTDCAYRISKIDRRIIVQFADDDLKAYTNHMVIMMDYLEEFPGAVIFNPEKKNLWICKVLIDIC